MNLGTQQLSEIYNALMEQFAGDPTVRVQAVGGIPPEQYEIYYDILCTSKSENGSIEITRGHAISLSIPFGYPHFPPSCRPVSNTFHPDFDDAAICLGDFWQNHRDLVLLIHHIGSMLCGEIYSLENAFNEDAAQWFCEHSSSLPFQRYEAQFRSPGAQDPPNDLAATIISPDIKLSVETLEDDDFDDSLDRPLAPTDTGNDRSTAMLASTDPTQKLSAELWELARKKQFNQLKNRLDLLSHESESVEDKETLLQQTQAALSDARKLFNEADNLECQGAIDKAIKGYTAVRDRVADFPNIEAALARAEQSRAILQELSPQDYHPLEEVPGQDVAAVEDLPPPIPEPSNGKKLLSQGTEALGVLGRLFTSIPFLPIIIVASALLLVGTIGFFYHSFSSQYQRAQSLLADCQTLSTSQDFPAAEKSCLNAIDTAKSLVFVSKSSIGNIQTAAEKILQSEEMKQGLVGLVKFNGKYIPKNSLDHQKRFSELIAEADKLITQEDWEGASSSFAKALEIYQNTKDLAPDNLPEVEMKSAFARFHFLIKQAQTKIEQNDHNNAIPLLTQAQKLTVKLSAETKAQALQNVDTLLSKCQFDQLQQQANRLFANQDWQGAYPLFSKALELGRNLQSAKPQDLADLQSLSIKAHIYALIEDGNTAFSSQQWNMAIENFAKAKSLLRGNEANFSRSDLDKNQQKLDRIILQANVVRNRQLAETLYKGKDLSKAQNILQETASLIRSSSFTSDTEFSETASEINTKLRSIKDEIFINEKIKYLTENYKGLFLEHYPTAKSETLSNPSITFEKRIDQLFVFQMRCTDISGGRRLTLVMLYAFDQTSNRWKFYSDT